ncbi:MAG: surface lipoprotein assembly modifier [Beijerinckiaceae bacterium]|nr:surface lipoprotein assembly modifier [Beijerinckiaceae bacterium]
MRSVWRFACLALLLAWSAPAASQSGEAGEKSAFEQIERLIGEARFEDARGALSAMPRESQYARVYGAFVQARIDEETGRLTRARDAYRAILHEHPDLARVRLHLARTLAKLEDGDAARRHYEFVLGAPDIAAPLADRVRNDLRALEGQKRWSAQGYVTVAPTTNMTSGPSRDVIVIGGLPFTPSSAGQKAAGVGALYGADLGYAAPIAGDWGWLATLSTNNLDYAGSLYDDRMARVSAGLRYLLPGGVATLEMTGGRRWFGGEGYLYSFGPLLTARVFASERDRITASASLAEQRYDSLDHQNGRRLTVSGVWDRFTLPGQFARVGVTFERETTRSDHLTYREFGGLAGYSFDMPMALAVYPEVAVALREYDGDFPLLGLPRRDRRLVGSLALVKKDLSFMGLAPRMQVSYTMNLSNVKFYEYDRFDVSLTLTRGF